MCVCLERPCQTWFSECFIQGYRESFIDKKMNLMTNSLFLCIQLSLTRSCYSSFFSLHFHINKEQKKERKKMKARTTFFACDTLIIQRSFFFLFLLLLLRQNKTCIVLLKKKRRRRKKTGDYDVEGMRKKRKNIQSYSIEEGSIFLFILSFFFLLSTYARECVCVFFQKISLRMLVDSVSTSLPLLYC